jgi:hypothetical protein
MSAFLTQNRACSNMLLIIAKRKSNTRESKKSAET